MSNSFEMIVCPHGETGPKNKRDSEGAIIELDDRGLFMAYLHFYDGAMNSDAGDSRMRCQVAGQRQKETATHRSIQPVVDCPGRLVQQVVRTMVDSYTISRVSPGATVARTLFLQIQKMLRQAPKIRRLDGRVLGATGTSHVPGHRLQRPLAPKMARQPWV